MYSHRRYKKKRDEMNPFIAFLALVAIAAFMIAWVVFCSVSQDKSLGQYLKTTSTTVCLETTNSYIVCH